MLSCIVGTLKLDAGDVFVFGQRPGTPGSGIPGRAVGYMPQVRYKYIIDQFLIIRLSLSITVYSFYIHLLRESLCTDNFLLKRLSSISVESVG
jgi:hypothetical protein